MATTSTGRDVSARRVRDVPARARRSGVRRRPPGSRDPSRCRLSAVGQRVDAPVAEPLGAAGAGDVRHDAPAALALLRLRRASTDDARRPPGPSCSSVDLRHDEQHRQVGRVAARAARRCRRRPQGDARRERGADRLVLPRRLERRVDLVADLEQPLPSVATSAASISASTIAAPGTRARWTDVLALARAGAATVRRPSRAGSARAGGRGRRPSRTSPSAPSGAPASPRANV